jgi:Zn-dependent peptidase ImmA (M78 family)/DNA-binding XRE family transcriptional regulator
MPAAFRALVTPALLVWARESAALSVASAAQKAGVAFEKLQAWEVGEVLPSVPQLRKLGEVYKRPIAVFYLAEPPKTFDVLRDFRRIPEGGDPTLSPSVIFEARQARYRRQVALELAKEIGETPLAFSASASLDDDVDSLAEKLRAGLRVPLEAQFQWRDKYDALANWKLAVEAAGALVFQASGVAITEMRGFSVSEQYLPLIVVNAKDSPRGRIFTILHEFVHLALRTSGVCDLHDGGGFDPALDRIEVFCNRVAGAVLMPRQALIDQYKKLVRSGTTTPDEAVVSTLADRFSVSQEALLRSLVLAGEVSEAFYASRRRDFLAAYDREEANKKSVPVPVYRRALGWNGYRYSRLVLDAYDDERISGSDLSDYLGVKLRHVENIRLALTRREAAE